MEYLEVRNLDKYQDRRASRWIKVHFTVLTDYDTSQLTPSQKWMYIGLIMLGAQNGNRIPNDPKWIGDLLGADSSEDQYGLGPLLRRGLIRVVGIDSDLSGPDEERSTAPSQADRSITAGEETGTVPATDLSVHPARFSTSARSCNGHSSSVPPPKLAGPSSCEDERLDRKKERKKDRGGGSPSSGIWSDDFDLDTWITAVAEAHPKGLRDTFVERAAFRLTQPPPVADEVIRCIQILEATPEWQKDGGRYIASFEKFVASRGWEMAYKQGEPRKAMKSGEELMREEMEQRRRDGF